MKKAFISQSNYIPWKGYFDAINSVDVFVIYDDMQYTKRDWRNRNKIKTPNGLMWLTIPVEVSGKYLQKINETKIDNPGWAQRHWETIKYSYGKAPGFQQYKEFFESLYLECEEEYLSQINFRFLIGCCDLLDIRTQMVWSSDFRLKEGKSERLLSICKDLNADVYCSGISAKGYLDEGMFNREGIKVEWLDYSGYPAYPQLYGEFEHQVSILDLLFNTGSEAKKYMTSFINERQIEK